MFRIYDKLPKFIKNIIIKILGFDLSDGVAAFDIPSDNDDSSLNLVIGSFLRKNKDKYQKYYEMWEKANFNYTGLYE